MSTIDTNLPIGTLVGNFRITEHIAAGGFGIVYKAEHIKFGLMAAIKEYLPSDLGVRVGDNLSVMPRTHEAENYQYGLAKVLININNMFLSRKNNIIKKIL